MVEGYDDLLAGNATELSGVTCPDDETLVVKLSSAYADFPFVASHPALAPVPECAESDVKSFYLAPVGNGPFMMDGKWEDGQEINLKKFDDYYGDKAKIDEALDMFEEAGVSAVLALRGDYIDGEQLVGEFNHASDLVSYIRSVKPDFKVFGACYPEGHYQADSLDQDIENLKIKVDAGVTHLISQLFYDNEDFYRFLDKARAAGITVPIEAGIMPVRGAKSVRRMAERNASRIPDRLNTLLNKWGDDIQSLRAAGILYASEQIADLVAHDVDGVHLYSMNHPATTRRIWRNAEPLFRGTQG